MGMSIVVLGVLGNLFNLMVFLSLKTFRQSSCAFYLIVMSFINIGQLILGQFSRVLITGFGIDFTQTSLFFCKFRWFAIYTFSFISFTCICFATIDQFLATCDRVYWQQWSNIKLARRLSAGLVLFWIIYGIPYLIFYNQTTSATTGEVSCASTSINFRLYHTYMNNTVLSGCLPILITGLFGSLAFQNIRQTAYRTVPLVRRELDKQLTNMVLVQDVIGFLVVLPYVILTVLSLTVSPGSPGYDSAKASFATTITACFYYMNFAVSSHKTE